MPRTKKSTKHAPRVVQAVSRLMQDRETLFRRVLRVQPDQGEAHYGLALVLAETTRLAEAIPHFAAALKAAPDRPDRWGSLLSSLLHRGDVDTLRELLNRFVAVTFDDTAAAENVRRDLIELLFQAGLVKHTAEDRTGAEAIYDLIILLDPRHANTLRLAAVIAFDTGRTESAWHLVNLSLAEDDGAADSHKLRGFLLHRNGQLVEAADSFRRSRDIVGDDSELEFNLGTVLKELKLTAEAAEHLLAATQLDPKSTVASCNYAWVLGSLGRLDECLAELERGLSHRPDSDLLLCNRAMNILYSSKISPELKLAAARDFERRCAAPLLRARPFPNDRRLDRRLRIGVVSSDFRQHVCMFFFEPVLRHLDPHGFELFAYSNTSGEDAITARIKDRFHHWRPIVKLDNAAAADLIERDRIDILVDLNGHSAGNRLLVFAHKPAPVQVSWIGFPGSTGMATMDYRFTDMSEPPGAADTHNVETLWRLPDTQLCYNPLAAMPDPLPSGVLPMDENGFITFGCFNNMQKVTDEVLLVWKRLLEAAPTARLLLRGPTFDDEGQTAAYRERVRAAGLPMDRVTVEPGVSEKHFNIYHRIDVALDPFPYNGVTTSMDSLYMGVPFVALDGDHHIAKIGATFLRTLGLPEFAAANKDDYVAIGAALAGDPDRLRASRYDLRARMERSPLMDGPGLAAKIGTAFRQMWNLWVDATPQPEHDARAIPAPAPLRTV